MPLSKPMKQIDTGITSYVWATDANQDIYYLNGNTFEHVAGKLIHVSSGEAGVWGVNFGNNIFFRDATSSNPKGTSWKLVDGSLMQIDSGPNGVVCGVTKGFEIFCRAGITEVQPVGLKWVKISGQLKYISCGAYGYWGISENNDILFTTVMSGANTQWNKIDGGLVQVEAGPNDQVWGVSGNKELYTRIGVSQSSPSGFSWKKIGSRSFLSVTIGLSKLYAIDVGYSVYVGSIVRQTSPGLYCKGILLKNKSKLNLLVTVKRSSYPEVYRWDNSKCAFVLPL